jgi:hypothetical protein
VKKLLFFLFFMITLRLPGAVEESFILDLNDPQLIRALIVWTYHPGDNLSWAHPDFDDNRWSKVAVYKDFVRKDKGNHWYRKKIWINGELIQGENLVIRIRHLAQAYELYWDGHLITANGTVSNNLETEKVGSYSILMTIPKKFLDPGMHTAALRVSNHSRNIFSDFINLNIGYALRLESGIRHYQDKNLLFVGMQSSLPWPCSLAGSVMPFFLSLSYTTF